MLRSTYVLLWYSRRTYAVILRNDESVGRPAKGRLVRCRFSNRWTVSAPKNLNLDVLQRADNEVRPVVRDLEPQILSRGTIDQMKELVYGLAIGERTQVRCRVAVMRITEEIARGGCRCQVHSAGTPWSQNCLHATVPQQQERYLPLMATGELRATMLPSLMAGPISCDSYHRRLTSRRCRRLRHQWGEDLDHHSRMSDVVALCAKPTLKQPLPYRNFDLLVEKVPVSPVVTAETWVQRC